MSVPFFYHRRKSFLFFRHRHNFFFTSWHKNKSGSSLKISQIKIKKRKGYKDGGVVGWCRRGALGHMRRVKDQKTSVHFQNLSAEVYPIPLSLCQSISLQWMMPKRVLSLKQSTANKSLIDCISVDKVPREWLLNQPGGKKKKNQIHNHMLGKTVLAYFDKNTAAR